MNDKDFWQQIYTRSLNSGNDHAKAKTDADRAVAAQKKL
jgi:hypothetical protein